MGSRVSLGKGDFPPEREERVGQLVHGVAGPGHRAESTEDGLARRRVLQLDRDSL